MRSSSDSTARRVIAMLSPVSPSATGKTFRSLTSCRRRSSSAQAFATTLRKRTSDGSGTGPFYTRRPLDVLEDLACLEAASADVLAARGAVHRDADLLKVRVEAPLRGDHRMAAAVPERRALSA